MILNPNARELYGLTIDTTPTVDGWDASFDDGETWQVGTPVEGEPGAWQWLVAGPTADRGEAVAVLPKGVVTPLLRLTAHPEQLVREGPPIYVGWPS